MSTKYNNINRLNVFRGGESVSQPPLKDKAFLAFPDQNPPFELRPENGFSQRQGPVLPMAGHPQMTIISIPPVQVSCIFSIRFRALGEPGLNPPPL
jgi:hypothetical protein